jgi:hypothetical protein
MSFCTNCGAQLEDNQKFCTSCGAMLKPEFPNSPEDEIPTGKGKKLVLFLILFIIIITAPTVFKKITSVSISHDTSDDMYLQMYKEQQAQIKSEVELQRKINEAGMKEECIDHIRNYVYGGTYEFSINNDKLAEILGVTNTRKTKVTNTRKTKTCIIMSYIFKNTIDYIVQTDAFYFIDEKGVHMIHDPKGDYEKVRIIRTVATATLIEY